MRLSSGVLALSLIASGCAHAGLSGQVLPGSPEDGDWIPFYSRESEPMRQDYFYDRSRLRKDRNRVVARWKVLNRLHGETSITMYVVDIDCRRATFTEAGTVIIEADGRRRELPRSELLVDGPTQAGTSADLFRRTFCR
jgi:hypothetical protein